MTTKAEDKNKEVIGAAAPATSTKKRGGTIKKEYFPTPIKRGLEIMSPEEYGKMLEENKERNAKETEEYIQHLTNAISKHILPMVLELRNEVYKPSIEQCTLAALPSVIKKKNTDDVDGIVDSAISIGTAMFNKLQTLK